MAVIKKFLYRVFCGFFLGISIVAPGFSGSIVAIIMGIYQDILRIVSNPLKELKKNAGFILPLAIGGAISAVLFVFSFKYLFDTYEKATYLLFVGLIAGNLPVIYAKVRECGFKWHHLIGGVCAFAAALMLGALSGGQITGADGSAVGLHMMAFGGLAAGVTALMPGVSISMMLILMGVYSPLLSYAETLLRLQTQYLLPSAVFVISTAAGLVLASKGIKIVFDRYPGVANTAVLGFMAGSLVDLFIQSLRLPDPNFSIPLGALMLAAGLGISILFVVFGKRMETRDHNADHKSS